MLLIICSIETFGTKWGGGECPVTPMQLCVEYCNIQWNLVITRSDITKSSYNEVIMLVPVLYISLFFYPDIMRNLI